MKVDNQVKQLKLNVTNIHSFLVSKNKEQRKLKSEKRRLTIRKVEKQKLNKEEKILESPVGKSLDKIKDSVAVAPGMSLLDRLIGFGSLILAGILVNALPGIIKEVQDFIDNLVSFVTPIYSGFLLLKAVIDGQPLDDPELSPEKKRMSDQVKKLDKEIEKIKEDLGPLGFITKPFDDLVDAVFKYFRGDKIVLATKTETDAETGEKKIIEGFKDLETGTFIKRKFTDVEKEEYNKARMSVSSTPAPSATTSAVKKTERESDMTSFREDATENAELQRSVMEGSSSGRYGSLLDFIGSGEGGYNSMNQGTQGNSIVGSTNNASSKLGKNLTDMTIGEIMDRQAYLMNRNNPQISDYGIFAAGKYQIIPKTMPGAVRGAELNRSDKFTPQNQDKLGMALIMNKRPYVGKYLRGEHNDVHGAMMELAREFASMPNPDTGRSLYGSGNKAFHSVDEVREALIKARTKPQPKITPAPNNKSDQARVLNQKDPRKKKNSTIIAVQRVNTKQIVPLPTPVPVKSKSFSSASQPQLSPLWA